VVIDLFITFISHSLIIIRIKAHESPVSGCVFLQLGIIVKALCEQNIKGRDQSSLYSGSNHLNLILIKSCGETVRPDTSG
jgi:hypothetical protein